MLAQLSELAKLTELQSADLERYRRASETQQPNQPERVPSDQLQLAFEQVLAGVGDDEKREALQEAATDESEKSDDGESVPEKKPGRKGRGGRRRLDQTALPVRQICIDPDEVVATQGEGFTMIGSETAERLAFQPASYFRLQIVRRKWARVGAEEQLDDLHSTLRPISIASLPDSVWPYFMADPSAIGQGIVSKYGDLLPLNRQQGISRRHGFEVTRSTLCSWLRAAYPHCRHVVDAMMKESLSTAFCMATDSTSAPVRTEDHGPCDRWQVFVFIADHDHVVFRHARSGTKDAVSTMLKGYRGHVLADAASIFDVLFEDGMTEVGCWSHQRRYFWKALGSQRELAMQALSLISKLFMVDRLCAPIEMPERTAARADRARPILDAFDDWVKKNKPKAEPRGPLERAIGYYQNQRGALRRFLVDGRLSTHNNRSESNLRNLVLGRLNWVFFENETGLKYYTVFRSLLASCALHGLNSQDYLDGLLRLSPHWPANRLIELAPKYWTATIENLSPRFRAALDPPWERDWPMVGHAMPELHQAA